VRRTIFGLAKVVVFVSAVILGCSDVGVEVVKVLPEPPVDSLPARPKRVEPPKQPTKVAKKTQGTWRGAAEPGWIPPGGISSRWEYIVVHHSATGTGSASEFHHAHQNRGWDELGYHFVIGNGSGSGDGRVEVGSRWYKQKHGAHCKTAGNYHNEHGIGVCLVGNFERSYPSHRQMASLQKLVRFLMARCRIPAGRVIGHCEAPGAATRCPGRHLNTAQLRATLRNYAVASDF